MGYSHNASCLLHQQDRPISSPQFLDLMYFSSLPHSTQVVFFLQTLNSLLLLFFFLITQLAASDIQGGHSWAILHPQSLSERARKSSYPLLSQATILFSHPLLVSLQTVQPHFLTNRNIRVQVHSACTPQLHPGFLISNKPRPVAAHIPLKSKASQDSLQDAP